MNLGTPHNFHSSDVNLIGQPVSVVDGQHRNTRYTHTRNHTHSRNQFVVKNTSGK